MRWERLPSRHEFLRKVRESRPAEGVERVMAPGDPEREDETQLREAQGIPVADEVWKAITELLEGSRRGGRTSPRRLRELDLVQPTRSMRPDSLSVQ